jgi:type IV pilus assembly protein PilX
MRSPALNSPSLNLPSHMPFQPARIAKQRGVALFFALVCLVAIMLAAVVLVRSVDTATLIAGNLAFQRSATQSADSGTEAALQWLATTDSANGAKNVLNDPSHAFNNDNAAAGYYSNLDPTKSLTVSGGTNFKWDSTDSVGIAADTSGNTTRYIIQRMCRTQNATVQAAECLFSGAAVDNNKQNIPLPQEICKGTGCPVAGQTPMIRITSRTQGPKNTLSYVQAYVY